jgi:hypothetical protein
MYSELLTFGDFIKLDYFIECHKLLKEIEPFEWHKYNPRKPIPRYGLSVTSLNGTRDGIDLDSLYEYNKENGTDYTELDFKTKTDVYYASEETRKAVAPFDAHISRTHFLKLEAGGYFPAHRDWRHLEQQTSFRVLVPIKNCNPQDMYFMYEGKVLHFQHGFPYFLNTNKEHCLFSLSGNSIMLVLNVECNKTTLNTVIERMASR